MQLLSADGSICVLDNLDFGTAEAGRIYYTTTTTAAQESVKMSAPFEAESAEQSAPATEVSFEKYSQPVEAVPVGQAAP